MPDGAEPGPADQPDAKLSDGLNHLAIALLKFAEDRFDLLRWEAAHEGSRISGMLVRGFCAALLGFLTLEVLVLLIVASFWDTAWRLQVLVGVMLAALTATLLLVAAYRRKSNEPSSFVQPAPGAHRAATTMSRP